MRSAQGLCLREVLGDLMRLAHTILLHSYICYLHYTPTYQVRMAEEGFLVSGR